MTNLAPPGYQTILIYGPAKIVVVTGKNDCRCSPWDETCARYADSWGMSMPSNSLLTGEDPYEVADRSFAFEWSRSIGKGGRWWNEEIYSGMAPGGVTWKKQTDPRELTTLLWMTLAHGAAGAMFWQYRPDHVAFESPGYNLAALDGRPTSRLEAVSEAISLIDGIAEHLPLRVPASRAAIVNHQPSHDLFSMNGEGDRFLADLRGTYRTLWTNGIPVDIVTPSHDWAGYDLVILSNVALMTGEVRDRIARTLADSPTVRLIAAGSFGMYSDNGLSSYKPPEGLGTTFGVRVADFSGVTDVDISQGRAAVETLYGALSFESPAGYAVLEPRPGTDAIASNDGQTVAVRTEDGRCAWYGFSLCAGLGDAARADLLLEVLSESGIEAPVAMDGDRVIPVVRDSAQAGRLLFLFNVEGRDANVSFSPRWSAASARDLFTGDELTQDGECFRITVPQWGVGVVHCG